MNQPELKNYPEGSILFDVRYSRNPESFEVIYWSPITKQLEASLVSRFEDGRVEGH